MNVGPGLPAWTTWPAPGAEEETIRCTHTRSLARNPVPSLQGELTLGSFPLRASSHTKLLVYVKILMVPNCYIIQSEKRQKKSTFPGLTK